MFYFKYNAETKCMFVSLETTSQNIESVNRKTPTFQIPSIKILFLEQMNNYD